MWSRSIVALVSCAIVSVAFGGCCKKTDGEKPGATTSASPNAADRSQSDPQKQLDADRRRIEDLLSQLSSANGPEEITRITGELAEVSARMEQTRQSMQNAGNNSPPAP